MPSSITKRYFDKMINCILLTKGKDFPCRSVSEYAMFADCPIQPTVCKPKTSKQYFTILIFPIYKGYTNYNLKQPNHNNYNFPI